MKKRKQNQSGKKLSLIKLQLSKITNMGNIQGGGPSQAQFGSGDCMFPEDASSPVDHGIKPPTQ
ncbi:hypothetical protein HHL23_13295 [Chryseobacterium sp. RP-3-3]|uniref:Uncharacterized protein n=1 Tax=Chryseobacterium antibioticum TaxID=2728847 RepID=A0A7Y0ANU2_9FLAO|nr:hypothetical protein [Chryseobacterium antibioticum]NML70762.1 hypothetical protein [Chryseobacterium antibioticum]